MMPSRGLPLGERIAALSASFEAFEKYTRDRWHKQDQDLQLLVGLPTQIERENGKARTDLGELITSAIEKALSPVIEDVSDLKLEIEALKLEVEALKLRQSAWTGARMFAMWVTQTILTIVAAVAAVLTIGHPR